VFCGDVIHHALQVYAPHWNHMADERPADAAVSRRRLLECPVRRTMRFCFRSISARHTWWRSCQGRTASRHGSCKARREWVSACESERSTIWSDGWNSNPQTSS
jgi:hypothetical protein